MHMRYNKGWKILVLFILSGILTLTGCGQEEASGGVTDVTDALFLSENEDTGETETTNGTAAASGSEVSEITNAAGETNEVARKLTDEECAQLQTFINEVGNYGFLLSVYENPADLDAEQVFFTGAGLGPEALSDEEREAYLEETGEEEAVNVFRIGAQKVSDYLQYRAGVSLDELTNSPDWVYLEDFDAFYISHGIEETNICEFEVTDAAVQNEYYRVHYRVKRGAGDLDGWHIPVYEAILKKNGDSYRFCANRLWMEQDLLLIPYRKIVLDSGEIVSLCSYKPDSSAGENADVTFSIVGDKDLEYNLPGMDERNIRKDMVFEKVAALDYGDYDGDGGKELVAVCKYKYTGRESGRADSLEARIYRFGESGEPELDLALSRTINAKVATLSLSGIEYYIANGADRGTYKDWKEAFNAEVEQADPESYDRFALIYINDDKMPELIELGKTPDKGAKIVFFRNGEMEETAVCSPFSYVRKGNLLYCKNGTDQLFIDALYLYTGNGFEVYQSGIYGTMDAALTAYSKDGKPEYTYSWEGSSISEAGYRDALSFICDPQRAVEISTITTATAQEFLEEMRKQ